MKLQQLGNKENQTPNKSIESSCESVDSLHTILSTPPIKDLEPLNSFQSNLKPPSTNYSFFKKQQSQKTNQI